jgi:hypothetical protein
MEKLFPFVRLGFLIEPRAIERESSAPNNIWKRGHFLLAERWQFFMLSAILAMVSAGLPSVFCMLEWSKVFYFLTKKWLLCLNISCFASKCNIIEQTKERYFDPKLLTSEL